MDKRKQVKEESETKKTHKRKTQNKRERYGGSDIEDRYKYRYKNVEENLDKMTVTKILIVLVQIKKMGDQECF